MQDKKFLGWLLTGAMFLVFNAAYVNTFALLGLFDHPIGHMTGNLAHVSIQLEHQQYALAAQYTLLITSFLSGAILTGVLVRSNHFSKKNHYGRALVVQSFFIFLAWLAFSKLRRKPSPLMAVISGAHFLHNRLETPFNELTGLAIEPLIICLCFVSTYESVLTTVGIPSYSRFILTVRIFCA